jgi:diphthine methyl ester acylhydrolase
VATKDFLLGLLVPQLPGFSNPRLLREYVGKRANMSSITPSSGDGRALSSKSSLVLDLPPSCVEFCPADSGVFVVGTYNLEREEAIESTHQSRNGSLVVFALNHDVPTVLQTIWRPSAILDLHFGVQPESQAVLGLVSSTGTFSAFRYGTPRRDSGVLLELSTSRIPGVSEGILFLSFAWHPARLDTVAVTASDGEVYLVKLDPGTYAITASRRLPIKNALECWCIAFSPDSAVGAGSGPEDSVFTVYSGGDDSILRYTSCRTTHLFNQEGEETNASQGLVGSIGKTHGAGVTAILPLPIRLQAGARVVVTGSYDDTIRIFAIHDAGSDLGNLGMQQARLLAEENLGGGVWRLKVMSTATSQTADGCNWRVRLLASCMHAGSRVVELGISESSPGSGVEVVGRFEEHNSMNYGGDFVQTPDGAVKVVSTSFYDRLLCVWNWGP